MDKVPPKILYNAPTRWLSYHECVTRILACWDSLVPYFDEVKKTEKVNIYMGRQLAEMYADTRNKAYLLFLKSVLKDFALLNKQFQASNANQLQLIEDLVEFYRKYVSCFFSFLICFEKIFHSSFSSLF